MVVRLVGCGGGFESVDGGEHGVDSGVVGIIIERHGGVKRKVVG